MTLGRLVFVTSLVLLLTCSAFGDETAKPLRAGIIGADTSHAVAYVKTLNGPKAVGPLAGVKIVAVYPGGSRDIPGSWNRVEAFTAQLRKGGVEVCDSIDELLTKVDVVMLESVDGRRHLEQVIPVFKAGKPVFIDKPVAGTLADAIKIYRLAEKHKVPCFSASSLRYSSDFQKMRDDPRLGRVVGCAAFSPCHLEPHHPDLYWYGVHGVEILYTIMGPGCKTVARTHTDTAEVAVGVWRDGRVGTFRGLHTGKLGYGATVFGTRRVAFSDRYEGYDPLLVEIIKFFKTGKPPVGAAETIEMFAFMEAADESRRQGGVPISIDAVMKKALAEADAAE